MHAIDWVRSAGEFLERFGIDNAIREAELIVAHCLKSDRVALYKDNPAISEEQEEQLTAFLIRRSKREPLHYILGYVEFYGLKIKIGKGVLIPRPETELLVEETIKTITSYKLQVTSKDKDSSLSILDLCTGSGCVALALARKIPDADVYGTDTSEIA
ncbi:MAG: peptide chain release factor N(5)-glutamine methyltransferase, partial [Nitrospira sp.]|nr:peptide chain release factor N(5)-glutamine methyltransferase [Nitrospira sp.]